MKCERCFMKIESSCLALSFIFLIISIRFSSLGAESSGVESLIGTFLSGDIVLYGFMLLTANMIAEAYSSGVMKNIIGRGIPKKRYYLSIIFTISAACVLVMLIGGVIMGVLQPANLALAQFFIPVTMLFP